MSSKSQASNLLIAFIGLWIVFSALCYFAFENANKAKKLLLKEISSRKKTNERIEEKKARLAKISNLLGFHTSIKKGGSFKSDPDAIIYKLDEICGDGDGLWNKSNLGISIDDQKLDKNDKIKKGETVDKTDLRDINFVRKLINLEDIWTICAERVEKLQKQVKEAKEKLKNEKNNYNEVKNETLAKIKRLHDKIQKKRRAIEEDQKVYNKQLVEAENKRNLAQKDKTREKSRVASLFKEQRLNKHKFDLELENLNERIRELQAEAAGETGIERWFRTQEKNKKLQDSPDGEIIYVNTKNKTAYIDLGRPEGVLKGMSFQVFRYGKGGKKIYKGKIVIRQVQKNMSKVGIVKLNNILVPIISGDKIINRVYDRNKVKYFVIAGKLSQKYSLDQVERLVKQIGGKIETNVTGKTDIVILAEGFRNDPVYKIAVERGIETMMESEFLGYLEE